MPNRILKESICTSESIDHLDPFTEVLFYRLIVNCDDYGRYDGRLNVIKNRLFPLKEELTAADVRASLRKLTEVGLVRFYQVGGRPYLWLNAWEKHQSVRAKKSRYPSPEGNFLRDEEICMQMLANVPVIQSNPIQNNESESESENESFLTTTTTTVCACERERGRGREACAGSEEEAESEEREERAEDLESANGTQNAKDAKSAKSAENSESAKSAKSAERAKSAQREEATACKAMSETRTEGALDATRGAWLPTEAEEEREQGLSPPLFREIYHYFKNELGVRNAVEEATKFEAYNACRGWDCLPRWREAIELWVVRMGERNGY